MDVPKQTWPSKRVKHATRPIVFDEPALGRGFFVTWHSRTEPPVILDTS